MVNLSSYTAAQLPLILCMISKNNDFGVGGNVKFFYRSEFYTHEHKNHQSEPEIYPLTICIYTKLIYGTVFEIWSNLCRKVAPRENPEKQTKKWNFLISVSKYQKYTKFPSRYMFLWMTNAIQLVKVSLHIIKDVKIQDGRQFWLENRFRYQAGSKIPKIWNLTHTPTHLVCNIHLILKFSQLSYESGCSHAFWCRKCATWHWNKYVLILLNFILYTYPKIYCCCRHKKL